MPPSRDLARNPGMCPDQESNWQRFGSQAGAQCTEPHQPGLSILSKQMYRTAEGPRQTRAVGWGKHHKGAAHDKAYGICGKLEKVKAGRDSLTHSPATSRLCRVSTLNYPALLLGNKERPPTTHPAKVAPHQRTSQLQQRSEAPGYLLRLHRRRGRHGAGWLQPPRALLHRSF